MTGKPDICGTLDARDDGPAVAADDQTGDEAALWARISAHRFDDADAVLDFTRRLARDHGWSRAMARDAIDEYRRFCFLAAVSKETPITPSPIVDEVWHLHLTYTVDYWQRWCRDVLRFELHHDPTRGGSKDAARFAAAYADTLARYAARFGKPHASIWPDVSERFRRPQRFRWVDVEQFVLLPRLWRRLDLRRSIRRGALGAALSALPAAQASALPINPLNWNGSNFLLLYVGLLVTVVLIGIPLLRRALRDTGTESHEAGLDSSEIACLVHGRRGAFDAAVASLMSQGLVAFEDGQLVQKSGSTTVSGLPASLLRRIDHGRSPKLLESSVDRELDQLEAALVTRGLRLDPRQQARVRNGSALLPLALLLFGAAKVFVGVSRHRPVDFLIVLCVITAIVCLLCSLISGNRRTLAGDRLVHDLRRQYAQRKTSFAGGDLAMAVAIVGTGALVGTAWAGYHQLRQPAGSSGFNDTSNDGDSGGDGGGGDGGGSGCGGCGGGD